MMRVGPVLSQEEWKREEEEEEEGDKGTLDASCCESVGAEVAKAQES